MIQGTNSVIDAARQLLAEFRDQGATPALWLIDPFALEEIKSEAGDHLQPAAPPHATFMGLPYESSPRYPGLELLTRDAALEAGHILA